MKDPRPLIEARFGHLPFTPPDAVPDGLAAILDRRVTRRYRAEPIPGPLLDTVLAAAASAPSKSDMQQWSVVVLEDPARIAAIADWIGTMPWIKEAPVLLVFCADVRRGRDICARHGHEHANDNLDTLLNATVDASLAMGMCVAAADAAGLGTCPISYVRNHLEKVGPLLALPKGVFPVAGLTLGFPAARNEPSARLPPTVTADGDGATRTLRRGRRGAGTLGL
ncbi:MAG: nitroreductase family protein [Rubritepida sp.]|nr:nitroreductase family protein [Rubritepida sp.]